MKHLIFYIAILVISFSALSAENEMPPTPRYPVIGNLGENSPLATAEQPKSPDQADSPRPATAEQPKLPDQAESPRPAQTESVATRVEDTNPKPKENPDGRAEQTEGRTEQTEGRAEQTEGRTAQAEGGAEHAKGKTAQAEPALSQLEKTNIAQAVIEGDIQRYQTALRELQDTFGISIRNLLTTKTSDGKTLGSLMITSKQNKEYFAMELIHLLTLDTIYKLNQKEAHAYSDKTIIELINIAKKENNPFAIQSLTDFDRITTKTYQAVLEEIQRSEHSFQMARRLQNQLEWNETDLRNHKDWLNEVLSLAQSPEYNINLKFSGVFRQVVGFSAFIGGTYSTLVSLADVYRLPQPLLTTYTKLAEMISNQGVPLTATYAGIIVGTALGIAGIGVMSNGMNRCHFAFRAKARL